MHKAGICKIPNPEVFMFRGKKSHALPDFLHTGWLAHLAPRNIHVVETYWQNFKVCNFTVQILPPMKADSESGKYYFIVSIGDHQYNGLDIYGLEINSKVVYECISGLIEEYDELSDLSLDNVDGFDIDNIANQIRAYALVQFPDACKRMNLGRLTAKDFLL
jgi:hypothetical protein